MSKSLPVWFASFSYFCLLPLAAFAQEKDFTPLFPKDGVPKGWVVTEWSDLAKKVDGSPWMVKDGVLYSVKRHDGSLAPPIKDRPRRGHIGFQYLSRDNGPVMIRNAWLKVLE